MDQPLTVGKLRGLQQISDSNGIFAMCAMDHRDSMRKLINKDSPDNVSSETLTEYKCELAEALAPVSTAILQDPIFGAAQVISRGVLPGQTGLLVSLEETGYEKGEEGRITTLLPDWSVEKVKRMGASAVKILLYYRPDKDENAARQRGVVTQVAKDCSTFDIPFLLEPITYPALEAEKEPAIFASHKADLVIHSARDLTPLGVDVLKAEFPADMNYEKDEGILRLSCERLAAASSVPWILLSAGVRFEEFARQVKIACQAGASGFLGGRAIWEEAMGMADQQERRHWLKTVAADRIRQLRDLAAKYAHPWWDKWTATRDKRVDVDSEWFKKY